MRPKTVEGGFYVDALADGHTFVSLIQGKWFETDAGQLALPSPTSWPLGHYISEDGIQIAGQASASPWTWHYNGVKWLKVQPVCNAPLSAMFDRAGVLHIIGPGPGQPSTGYRYLAPDGHLVTGDETIVPIHGINEWTDLSLTQDRSLVIGQGNAGGVKVWAAGKERRLANGDVHAIHGRRRGNDVVVDWYEVIGGGRTNSEIRWGTVADLEALPLYSAVVQPPVPDPPKPPAPPPGPAPDPPKPPAPPRPDPTKPPVPVPVPSPPIQHAKPYEVSMENEIVDLVGPGGFYARVDPKKPTRIFFDATAPTDQTEVEMSKPDEKYGLRFVKADVIVNFAPKWECGTDLGRQFETRPANARGAHEMPMITVQPDGRIIAYVEHETDGRKFTSAPLTVVPRVKR